MKEKDKLKFEISKLGIVLNEEGIERFLDYYHLLVEWNSFMNLTGITEFDEVIIKHFVDSLSLVRAIDLKGTKSVIDVGTGAGFPGLPLKIAFPELKITLLDSLQKRVKFLNQVISDLQLKGIDTIHGRAEDCAKKRELRESFELCVSRAVANLSTLSEYCIPFVKMDGYFISYKAEKLSEELKAADRAIDLLGGRFEQQIDFTIGTNAGYRNLVMIKKVRSTPEQYPRKSGIASKRPL